jgi:hypothetical protein
LIRREILDLGRLAPHSSNDQLATWVINKYTDFFHDGSINSIDHIGNEMLIYMESAEMDEEDVKDDIVLSEDDRIRGKLHVEGIKSIKINDEPFLGTIRKIYRGHFKRAHNFCFNAPIFWPQRLGYYSKLIEPSRCGRKSGPLKRKV